MEGRLADHLCRARELSADANDPRFVEAVGHTILYTVLSVLLPLIFGTFAAVVFPRQISRRGFLRGIFIMPMMATPVAIALVWTMMFHPQLGVLNYLLSLVGLPPQLWVFHPATVIPSLVLVGPGWTPLVMLIVLGGLAAIPAEPYESAQIDGARSGRCFATHPPLIAPFLFIAGMIRMIDAVKSFDIIFAITQGGRAPRPRPSTSISTASPLSITTLATVGDRGDLLPLDRGDGGLMLHLRQRTMWTEIAVAHERPSDPRQDRLWFAIFVVVSPAILFFLWMASLSVKFEVDNAAYPRCSSRALRLEKLCRRARLQPLLTYFINSLMVTGTATLLAMLVGVPAGYGIARMAAHKSAIVILIGAHHAGIVLSDSAVLAVPVARPARTLWPQIIIISW